MNLGQIWKYQGNLNRMIEMDAEGVGANAIVGVFKDNNIIITANQVRTILKSYKELSKKGLPKAEAQKLIQQNYLSYCEPT